MKYFTFIEKDAEIAMISLESVAAVQIDLSDNSITIGFFNAPSIVVDFYKDITCQGEFLRLTTAIQSLSDAMDASDAEFETFMFGGKRDD